MTVLGQVAERREPAGWTNGLCCLADCEEHRDREGSVHVQEKSHCPGFGDLRMSRWRAGVGGSRRGEPFSVDVLRTRLQGDAEGPMVP